VVALRAELVSCLGLEGEGLGSSVEGSSSVGGGALCVVCGGEVVGDHCVRCGALVGGVIQGSGLVEGVSYGGEGSGLGQVGSEV
jgi:hypothetical protein